MPISRRNLALLALLAGCRPDPRDPRCRRPSRYVGPPRRDVPPALLDGRQSGAIDGALDPARAAALESAAAEVLADSRSPGASLALALPGAGTWESTLGLASADPAVPAGEDALFQACSITKLVTAVLVLQLVERGALRLDAPVSRWFPDYPGSANMTIDHLLRHTSGAFSFNTDPNYQRDLSTYHPPEALIAEAAAHPNLFCPGATWSYSNTGYVMLGLVVERERGRPLADLIADDIAAPLGLRRLTAQRPDVTPAGLVSGHKDRSPLPGRTAWATPHAAGYLAASAGDLVRLLHALLAGRLLRPETLAGMLRDTAPMFEDPQLRYGQGLMYYAVDGGPRPMLGHSGGTRGARAIVTYVPADAAYVAVMFNDERPAEAGLWMLVQALRAAAPRR